MPEREMGPPGETRPFESPEHEAAYMATLDLLLANPMNLWETSSEIAAAREAYAAFDKRPTTDVAGDLLQDPRNH